MLTWVSDKNHYFKVDEILIYVLIPTAINLNPVNKRDPTNGDLPLHGLT